jgi:hypothetical protein
MKKTIVIAALFTISTCKLFAQSSADADKKYITAMETNIKMLDTATNPVTYTMLANNFERIANAEKNKWQPFYFASFCYAIMASNSQDRSKVDYLAEKAESYLALADALEKDNSEISTLRGMILYTRVGVDPMTRFRTLGMEAISNLEKAKQQDPNNPRPWLVDANAKLRTPEGMGGGPKVAKAAVETCLEKFKSFVPENSIAPNWGKAPAEKLLKSLNE